MTSKIYNANAKDYLLIQSFLESVNLPLDGVNEHLGNFILLKKGDMLIGTVGLEVYGDKALLRSLAVTKGFRGSGYGRQLHQAIIAKCRAQQICEIYLLTETAEDFFAKLGFEKISRDSADVKVKESIEFRSACPETATCMRLKL